MQAVRAIANDEMHSAANNSWMFLNAISLLWIKGFRQSQNRQVAKGRKNMAVSVSVIVKHCDYNTLQI